MNARQRRVRRRERSRRKMRVKAALMRVCALPFAAFLSPMMTIDGWRLPYASGAPGAARNPDQWIDSPREWRRNGMETR